LLKGVEVQWLMAVGEARVIAEVRSRRKVLVMGDIVSLLLLDGKLKGLSYEFYSTERQKPLYIYIKRIGKSMVRQVKMKSAG